MRLACKKEEIDDIITEDYEEHYEDLNDNVNDEDYIPDFTLEQEDDGDSFCADDLIEKDESFEDVEVPTKKSFDCGECGEKFFSGTKLIKY